MKTIALEIIAPDRVVYKGDIEFVVVPAYNGELGILPGHIPLIAQLLPGKIRIHKPDGLQMLVITGGLVEINTRKVMIFVDKADVSLDILRGEEGALKK